MSWASDLYQMYLGPAQLSSHGYIRIENFSRVFKELKLLAPLEYILSSFPFVDHANGNFRTLTSVEDLFNIGRCSRDLSVPFALCLTQKLYSFIETTTLITIAFSSKVWVSDMLDMKKCV